MALLGVSNTSIRIVIMCTEESAFDHELFFRGTEQRRWEHLKIGLVKRLRWQGKILKV